MIPEKGGDFLQWLRGFYYTVKCGGLANAANLMGRTQSSISHHIKCLEEDLGLQLFDRSGRGLILTEEGAEVLAKAVQIFDTVIGMDEMAHPKNEVYTGQVKIVCTHAILLNFLPKYVTRFRNQNPEINFFLDSGAYNYICNQIRNGDADFGIACPRGQIENLSFFPLFATNPVLVSPIKPLWDIPPEPKLRDIAKLPFISFPLGTSIEESIRHQFTSKGLSAHIVLQLTHFEHVKSYVGMGMGVSILDEYTLTDYDYQRLRIHPLPDFDEVRTYGVITRKQGYLSRSARAFLSLMHI